MHKQTYKVLTGAELAKIAKPSDFIREGKPVKTFRSKAKYIVGLLDEKVNFVQSKSSLERTVMGRVICQMNGF